MIKKNSYCVFLVLLMFPICALSAQSIPGLIEAESYNSGGQEVGYFDRSPGNLGSHPDFSDDIDISGIVGGLTYISSVQKNEWAKYDLDIETAGTYTIEVRQGQGGTGTPTNLLLRFDGEDGDFAVLPLDFTGGFNSFQTKSYPGVVLPNGEKTLRVFFDRAGTHVDWLRFTLTQAATNNAPIIADPGTQVNSEGDSSINLPISVSDPDGDDFTVTVVSSSLPPGIAFDDSAMIFIGNPTVAGSYNVTITADDGRENGFVTTQFQWNINPANTPLPVLAVSATEDDGNIPENTLDGNFSTRWSAFGEGQYIQYELDNTYNVSGVAIAWHRGDVRTADFDIEVSTDGQLWIDVLSNQTSTLGTLALQNSVFSATEASFVRIVGFGNSVNDWNSILEVEIYGAAILNSQPVINDPGNQTNLVGDSVSLSITADDADGDSLDFSATGLPGQLSIDSDSGLISGTLTAPAGNYDVTVTVSDGNGGSASIDFQWVVNALPVPTESIRLEAEDWDAFFKSDGTTPEVRDRDGGQTVNSIDRNDWLAFNIDVPASGDYTVIMRYTRGSSNPEQLRFEVDGVDVTGFVDVSPTPTWGDWETHEIVTLSLAAGAQELKIIYDGGINTNWFELVMGDSSGSSNTPPTINSNPGRQINSVGDSVNLSITADDADGDQLIFSADGLPDQLSIDNGSGLISGILTASAGTYDVEVTVSDGNGETDKVDFIWELTDDGVIVEENYLLSADLASLVKNEPFENIGILQTLFGLSSSSGISATADKLDRVRITSINSNNQQDNSSNDLWIEQKIIADESGLESGSQWFVPVPDGPYEELYYSYDIAIPDGHIWRRSGKFPGLKMGNGTLTGGTNLSDGYKPGVHFRSTFGDDWRALGNHDGNNRGQFTAFYQNSFGTDTGAFGHYVKYVGRLGEYGFGYHENGEANSTPVNSAIILSPGSRWRYQVYIKLNTRESSPYAQDGVADGIIKSWIQDITDVNNPGPVHINEGTGWKFHELNPQLSGYDGITVEIRTRTDSLPGSVSSLSRNQEVRFDNGATATIVEVEIDESGDFTYVNLTLKDHQGSLPRENDEVRNSSNQFIGELNKDAFDHSPVKSGLNDFFWSTFYGGRGSDYEVSTDQFLYFKNIHVNDEPIWYDN